MFHNARVTLTFWYVLIIMTVSIAFSAFIYLGAVQEFDRALRIQQFRLQHSIEYTVQENSWRMLPAPEQRNVIEDERMRTLEGLIGINIFILLVSSFAGYFLAGRTLRPIQEMVDEQDRFVTDASHELRTPLTSLRTEIEVGLRNKSMSLIQAKNLLESNLEEVIALQALSDNLLSLSQNKPLEKIKEKVILQSCIYAAIQKVESIAKIKEIAIKKNVSKLSVWGSAERLTEVFTILLDNAIKYSPKKTTISVQVKQQDSTVLVSIADAGMGIASEDMPHIFDRFYRANKSRSKDISGYGLGLSIAKKIVDAHNGHIAIIKNLPKGTKALVRLPLEK